MSTPCSSLPEAASEFGPDTVWLHAEFMCRMEGVDRDQLHAFFMRFGDGHMDEDPMVKGHLHDFELGVDLGKSELCFSASAAFGPARTPGGFMLSRVAYQTSRQLLFAVQEALHVHPWGSWRVADAVATVWNSGTDTIVVTVNYTPDLRTERFDSDQYLSVLRLAYTCRSMSWVYGCRAAPLPQGAPMMHDRLPQRGLLIAGGRWDFQTLGRGHDRTIWVEGLHWPGCDDVVGHGSIGFGVQRSDKFLQFNHGFWDELGLDYTLVREVAQRMQRPGDAGDVAAPTPPDGEGPEVR